MAKLAQFAVDAQSQFGLGFSILQGDAKPVLRLGLGWNVCLYLNRTDQGALAAGAVQRCLESRLVLCLG